MASSYPGSLDSFTNPASTDAMDASAALYHDVQHANVNDAIEAVQAELGTDPAGAAATVKARLDNVGLGGRHPVWPRAGYYYASAHGGRWDNSAAMNVNVLYYMPLWCPTTVTLAALVCNVVTGASGNVRLGVYGSTTSSGQVGPGSLVVDAGTADTSSTGYKEVSTSQSLTGDTLYWLAAVFSGTPTVTTFNHTYLGSASRTTAGTGLAPTWNESFTYGTLPASATAVTSLTIASASNSSPLMWVKL